MRSSSSRPSRTGSSRTSGSTPSARAEAGVVSGDASGGTGSAGAGPSAAVLSVGSSMQRRMNEEELLFIGGEFATAFRSYFEATPIGQRNYPAKLEELLRDPRYPGIRRHLRKIYVDPMTGTAEWGVVAAPGGIIGVHSLSQQAPIKIGQFDPAFAALTGKTSYAQWAFGFLPPGVVPAGNVTLAGTLAPVSTPTPQKPLAAPAGAPTSVRP